MLQIFHKSASPKHFYGIAGKLVPWFAAATALTLGWGLYQSFFVAPPDYQQGESVRIMFVHLPAAWMSMFIYMVMASAGAMGLIWNMKLAEMAATAAAPIGASYTFLGCAG